MRNAVTLYIFYIEKSHIFAGNAIHRFETGTIQYKYGCMKIS